MLLLCAEVFLPLCTQQLHLVDRELKSMKWNLLFLHSHVSGRHAGKANTEGGKKKKKQQEMCELPAEKLSSKLLILQEQSWRLCIVTLISERVHICAVCDKTDWLCAVELVWGSDWSSWRCLRSCGPARVPRHTWSQSTSRWGISSWRTPLIYTPLPEIRRRKTIIWATLRKKGLNVFCQIRGIFLRKMVKTIIKSLRYIWTTRVKGCRDVLKWHKGTISALQAWMLSGSLVKSRKLLPYVDRSGITT